MMDQNNTPARDEFPDDEKKGLYRAIYERKDIRTYRPEPIPAEKLVDILDGAHHAPSVGFMQPWNFIVIEDKNKKQAVYDHFLEVNQVASTLFSGERNTKYRSLKLQGILDAPLNILVTCDTSRGGKNVLGRTTIPQTDLYSTCLAIQNLWLCARAEGIGVGWMSLYEPDKLQKIFALPEHVIPVAYLTMGYAVEFPETPILESVGWRQRLPLEEVLFYNQWEQTSPESQDQQNQLSLQLAAIISSKNPTISNKGCENKRKPSIQGSNEQTGFQERNLDLTKPPGSMGALEPLLEKIATIQNTIFPSCAKKDIILVAADHGVAEEGVSAYNQELTAKMVYQFLAGGGAISSLCREYSIKLHIADAGVDHDFDNASGLIDIKIDRSTRNFTTGPAMTKKQMERAVDSGKDLVDRIDNPDMIGLGEMGIGNSTSASAVCAALLNLSAEMVTGAGTGVGSKTLLKKTEVIKKGLLRIEKGNNNSPDTILQELGGFEIAVLTGVIYRAFEKKIPVVLDGFITTTAAMIAVLNKPEVADILIAGHISKEPGHRLLLERLNLTPVLDLKMALGEGSGAAFAMGVIDGAVRVIREIKTFTEAGIENPINHNGKL